MAFRLVKPKFKWRKRHDPSYTSKLRVTKGSGTGIVGTFVNRQVFRIQPWKTRKFVIPDNLSTLPVCFYHSGSSQISNISKLRPYVSPNVTETTPRPFNFSSFFMAGNVPSNMDYTLVDACRNACQRLADFYRTSARERFNLY